MQGVVYKTPCNIFSIMKSYTLFLFICLSFSTTAQKHSNIWITGYNGQNPHPLLSGTFYDFSNSPLELYRQEIDLNFWRTNASICDTEGNLLFYTNGGYIFNANHELMENGDSLSAGEYANVYADVGFPVTQGGLILPKPNHDSIYLLFHNKVYLNGADPSSYELLMTEINMNLDDGNGGVSDKNELLISDILAVGKITATKHANGRDWWIMVFEKYSDIFYKLLLTSNGIEMINSQDMDIDYTDTAIGMSRFTPDGSKYVKYDLRFLPIGNVLDIYDFDRCSGELSNPLKIPLGDTTAVGGITFSPSSRFLYTTSRNTVYQFDLWSNDIEASKLVVGEYDGFISEYTTPQFHHPALAPDGKIYITPDGTDRLIHRINLPNLTGTSCEVVQRAIEIPTFIDRSFPNFPNYRLGPLDGSPCDTLGLNNHPLAGFTWETDSLTAIFSNNTAYMPTEWNWDFAGLGSDTIPNPVFTFPEEGNYNVCQMVSNEYDSDTLCQEVLVSFLQAAFEWNAEELAVNFTDVSISEPFDWFWEFGDEATSTAQHPIHDYAAPGMYEVCLTVMDDWAEAKMCDSVMVDIIDGVSSILETDALTIYPNPATEEATIVFSTIFPSGSQLAVYNVTGQLVESVKLEERKIYQIDLKKYQSGIYWVQIIGTQQDVLQMKKLVVVK